MKKLIAIMILLESSCLLNSQNQFPVPTGNVQIVNSSNTNNPTNELEIETVTPESGLQITQTYVQAGTQLKGAAALHLRTLSAGKRWSLYSLGTDNVNWGGGNFAISENPLNIYPRILIRANFSNSNFPIASTGNVGINTDLPDFKLDVNTAVPDDGIRVTQISTGGCALYLDSRQSFGQNWGLHSLGSGHPAGPGNFVIYQHPISAQGTGVYRLFINNQNGNVGIGSITPGIHRLDVDAPPYHNGMRSNVNGDGEKIFVGNNKNANKETFIVFGNGKTEIYSTNNVGPEHAFVVYDALNNNTKNFVIQRNGTVYAREIFVNLGIFPDYVFSEEHKLMPLDELDRFIKINHHLPNVPSAKEVEEKGIGLGDLSKIQMEKIEELTLYVIELKKEIDLLKKKH